MIKVAVEILKALLFIGIGFYLAFLLGMLRCDKK